MISSFNDSGDELLNNVEHEGITKPLSGSPEMPGKVSGPFQVAVGLMATREKITPI